MCVCVCACAQRLDDVKAQAIAKSLVGTVGTEKSKSRGFEESVFEQQQGR